MGVIKKIQDMKNEMTRWRQKLHQDPELAFEERATARFITRQLQSFGIEVHGLTKTGVIGVLHGKNGPAAQTGGKAIMLRADMDALPIKEETGVMHCSRNSGVHHACGHDGHMTMLLGAAKYLAQTRDFDGTVYFVFQPAEEHIGGANELIKAGLFKKFPCDEVYGLHNFPGIPLGVMASGAGPLLAASDEFHITFNGTGGHIARPENTTNIIAAAAEAATAIKAAADKEIPAGEPALMIVASINTDSQTTNVLPDSINLQGSIRTFDTALHDKLKKNLEQIVNDTAAKYGATATLEFKNSYPALINSKAETAFALDIAKDIVGANRVISPVPRTLGIEDFAYYLHHKPGNFMCLGTGKADGSAFADLHSAKYDFNDAALPIGASYWVKLVEKALPFFKAAAPQAPKTPDAPKP
jgi:hippurate hydrolase